MNGSVLQTVDHQLYLGVDISNDLTWAQHINQSANKANRILGLLRRNIYSCNKTVKDAAYKSLIRPRLEYCGAVWDPYYKTDKLKLEKVQRRAARFVLNNYNSEDSVTDMLDELKWEPLDSRRVTARLIAIYKEVHKITPSNIQFQNCTRSTRRNQGSYIIATPPFNKTCYQYSLYPRTIREWNLLPPNIREAPSVESFKSRLTAINLQELVSRAHLKI